MQVHRFIDPNLFLALAEPFLLRAEVEHHFFLSLRGLRPMFGDPSYLAAIEHGGQVVSCALRTPPFKLVITRGPAEAYDLLAGDLATLYAELPAVLGPEPAVDHFARAWARRSGQRSRYGMRQGLFEARSVIPPPAPPPGIMRKATDADLPILVAWAAAFHAETHPTEPAATEQDVRARIRPGSVVLWDDGQAVSMAGWAGRTARGVRVNFVYTPPEHRRRGYASACVATLTQQLLDEGQTFCCLYTDLSNPTSNAIYQAIGYRPVCELSDIVFAERGR